MQWFWDARVPRIPYMALLLSNRRIVHPLCYAIYGLYEYSMNVASDASDEQHCSSDQTRGHHDYSLNMYINMASSQTCLYI